MKKSNNALFCVIFPSNLKFIGEFIDSINNQTTQDFDVFFVNDGVDELVLSYYLKYLERSFKIHTIECCRSFAKIREVGIKEVLALGYENIIFADTDDLMSEDRVKISVEALEMNSIVFNDLDLMDVNKNVISRKIWSDRLSNVEVTSNFLLDKNVLGLGNTAIKTDLLKNLTIPDDIMATDWFIFFNIIKDKRAKFIDDAETYYRQHDSNCIGIGKVTEERLKHIINVKKIHYKYIPEKILGSNLRELEQIERKITNPEYMQSSLIKLNDKNIEYFWWEETNFLKNI